MIRGAPGLRQERERPGNSGHRVSGRSRRVWIGTDVSACTDYITKSILRRSALLGRGAGSLMLSSPGGQELARGHLVTDTYGMRGKLPRSRLVELRGARPCPPSLPLPCACRCWDRGTHPVVSSPTRATEILASGLTPRQANQASLVQHRELHPPSSDKIGARRSEPTPGCSKSTDGSTPMPVA